MPLSKREREQLLKKHCGAINSDDAIDPRHYFANKRKHAKKYRKVFQLCRQVSNTLQLVINEGDDRLNDLQVVDVVPAPDSRRLLVLVSVDLSSPLSAGAVDELMMCLQNHIPRLRAEIARAINRRKTPNLVFEFTEIKPD